jgi:tetratricopeptide (TPR) repeat protein
MGCSEPRCFLGAAAALIFVFASSALAQGDLAKLYSEAQQAQAAGDLAAATRKYEAIVQLQPHMAEAYANLGNLYYEQGQTDRAKSAFRKAIQQKPEMTGPRFFLGVIAFGEHDYVAALDHLGKAAATQPSNALIYAYLGYVRFARSEFAEATGNFEKANALNDTDIDVLYHLSKSYGHLADQAFAKLQAAFPDSVYPILARAHLAEINEDTGEAARQYGLALEKMPDNVRLREKAHPAAPAPTARDELVDGSLTYKESPPTGPKLKEEISSWQSKMRGFATNDSDARQHYLQGEGYQVLAYLTSLAVFDVDQDSYRAHQLRAQMFEQSNNDDGAIQEYREALKRKPELQNIHFAIGTLYWKDHHQDEAWTELQLELKANPHHPQALYELGDICAFTERSAEAEKYFLQAVKLEPGMAEAHYALEKIYTESGRYDQSLEQLRAALKINASDPTAHYRLAAVYRKLGKPREAERELTLFDRSRVQPAATHNGSSTVR